MIEKDVSRELYLQTIHLISQELNKVRNIDISKKLRYSKPSVTIAMKKLYADGLIFYDEENGIQLTEKGLVLVEQSADRCNVLASFFMKLGLEKDAACENARLISNQITDELFKLIHLKVTNENSV